MAGKVNTFKAVMIIAGGLCVTAIALQITGIITDHLQSVTDTETRHWGLWNFCYETSGDTKCYSLVTSDEYVLQIIWVPSLWKLFQAANVVGLLLLVVVFILIATQICCLKYSRRSIVTSVTLSTLAGSLILTGCTVYAVLYAVFKSGCCGYIDNGYLEYSFGLLVATGVLAIICAIILNVARRNFPNDQTRPASSNEMPDRQLVPSQNIIEPHISKSKYILYQIYAKIRSTVNCFPSVDMSSDTPSKLGLHIKTSLCTPLTSDITDPRHVSSQGTPSSDVISYQRPHSELQHSAYSDRLGYNVTEHKSLLQ